MIIKPFFDAETATFTYVVSDEKNKKCAIIDSVLNYDMASGRTTTHSADAVIEYIKGQGLQVEWILETHVHADHLTASTYLKQKLGGKTAISEPIKEVLEFWVPIFNTYEDTPLDASQFDHLFKDNEQFTVGNLEFTVMYTPGHTPACVSYYVDHCIFVGDTIFMPYVGTARTDFPGASAGKLYDSIQKLLSLPDDTFIYTGHDYPQEGNQEAYQSTVKLQKETNSMIHQGITREEFIAARNQKDKNKSVPKLLLPALQVNLRAGNLGNRENNEIQYIKIPLNQI